MFTLMLLNVLRAGRTDGTIRPDKPILAREIIERYGTKFAKEIASGEMDRISGSTVRQSVNELRTKYKAPIGSVSGNGKHGAGYFYAKTASEYKDACGHLLSRARLEFLAYYNPLKRFEEEGSAVMFDETSEDPIVLALIQEFGLTPYC